MSSSKVTWIDGSAWRVTMEDRGMGATGIDLAVRACTSYVLHASAIVGFAGDCWCGACVSYFGRCNTRRETGG
jgi:hypothetical protein